MILVTPTLLALLRSDACGSPFVPLLSFGLSTGETLRYARYASDVTYGGQVYTAWSYEATILSGGRGNTVKTLTLTIRDETRTLRSYAAATQWFRDCILTMDVVNVDHVSLGSVWGAVEYDILQAKPASEAIAFTLGGQNVAKMRFPANRYWAWQCPYARGFKVDPRCAYAGDQTVCNGTPSRCLDLDNLERFGGFYGLDPEADTLILPVSIRSLA